MRPNDLLEFYYYVKTEEEKQRTATAMQRRKEKTREKTGWKHQGRSLTCRSGEKDRISSYDVSTCSPPTPVNGRSPPRHYGYG